MTSYISVFEKVLNYIEDHLSEEVDLSAVAQEAGYSLYHFQRIFRGVIGDSLKDYIIKRRLTEAAKELANSDLATIDIALKYGYQSREAFSRSFKKTIGRNPSDVKKDGLLYNIREAVSSEYIKFEYSRRKFGMTPEIVTLPKRLIVGKKYPMNPDGSFYQEIPIRWKQWLQDQSGAQITSTKNKDHFYGILLLDDNRNFDYMIGHEVSEASTIPADMTLHILEPARYAVFETIGPITESVQKTWDYIYSTWLPASDFEHSGSHDIEYYFPVDGELVSCLYVPV